MELTLKNTSFSYDPGAKKPVFAVRNVSFTIHEGEFSALIGHTGSGKSTLVQFLNGLLKPTFGEVLFNGENIFDKKYPLKELRQKVGLVFQYPEHQLFEETVLKDICFGPKNMGLPKEERIERARHAMRLVGLSESYEEKSPFELSGGEKRRVAIAGVLAMEPQVLILDEPTAGLDPKGHQDILDMVKKIHADRNLTILLVSHNMDDAARLADRILVLDKGHLAMDGTPPEVFSHYDELHGIGLSTPSASELLHLLKQKGLDVDPDIFDEDEAAEEIVRALNNK